MRRLYLLLAMVFALFGAAQAQRTVTGTVTDDAGDPLVGCSVLAKGTSAGTVTDIDGRYKLAVPAGASTLVFSYTGYQVQEIALGSGNEVNVTLSEGVTLSEAVVTALGITREQKSLGYAVQKVEGDQLVQSRDPNLVNALSGKVAGVNVVSSSGNVGSSSRVVIRGNTSILGENGPLFVINGIPVDNTSSNWNSGAGTQFGGADFGNTIADINPDDIENISVLKGPNAAALYGSRGANGVILITTKSGKGRKKGIGVDFTSDVGFSNPFRLPDYQDKFGQGIGFQFNYVDGTGLAPGSLNDGIDESWGPSFDPAINGADGIDNDGDGAVDEDGEGVLMNQFSGKNSPWVAHPDNIKNAFDTGVTWNNTVAVTAAGDNMHGRLSYSNFNQKGMIPNTDLRRHNLGLNFGMKHASNLRSEGSVTYIRNDSDNRPGIGYAGDNILQQSIWAGRQVDWDYLRDNWDKRDENGQIVNWNHNYQNNPFFSLNRNLKPMNRDRITGIYSLTYDITSWLNVMGRVGNDFYRENRQIIFEQETVDYPNGYYQTQDIYSNERNLDLIFTINKRFGDNVSLLANIGATRRDNVYNTQSATAEALVVPGVYNLANADGQIINNQFNSKRRVNSAFGSLSLGFYDFIYADLTARNDWSSTLPKDNNSYFYPSVNLGVVLSEKISIPGVSYLKVRGGYANAARDTDPYRTAFTYAFSQNWGGVPAYGVPNSLPNTTLKPEQSISVEAGFEARALNNRLTLDFTYYNMKTVDQIIPLNVSATTGFNSRFTNAGTLRNKGMEIQVGITPVRTEKFTWDILVNWAKNNSAVEDLPEGVNEILLNSNWGMRLMAREGEPYGTLVGRRVKRTPDGQIILNNGLPVLDVDANGSNTNFNLGTITPDWTGGIRNTFTFGPLSLSALVDMRQGSDIFSMTYIFGRYAGVLEESLEGRNSLDEIINGYAYDGVIDNGDGTFRPNDVKVDAETWNAYYYARRHDRGVFDASFIKLREVTLTYQFPKSIVSKLPVSNLSLAAYGRNIALLHSNVPHIDPETAFDSSTAMQGIEFGQLPSARTYGLTLRASF